MSEPTPAEFMAYLATLVEANKRRMHREAVDFYALPGWMQETLVAAPPKKGEDA